MVSGASRGLGRAIAIAFAKSPLLPSEVPMEAVLLARSKIGGLDETGKTMKAVRTANLATHKYAVDLGNLDILEQKMNPIFERHSQHSFDDHGIQRQAPPSKAILINCAGTTGYIGDLPTSLSEIRQAADLNFTSKAWLTSRFLQEFPNPGTTVVNVSSMCAVKPTPSMALYCATAAAREMFHMVLAMDTTTTTTNNNNGEHGTSNFSRILNYAPGSCDTEMQARLRDHDSLDPAVQAYCKSLVSEGGLVKCEDTANELVRQVLEPDTFQSGERIEYVNMSSYNY